MNTTAKKTDASKDFVPPYLENGTYIVVSAQIVHPIEPFNDEDALEDHKK